jgi:chromosome segregation ATPase
MEFGKRTIQFSGGYMNCVKIFLIASLISSSVIAKVVCKPFIEEKQMMETQLDNFSLGLNSLYAKIIKLEERRDTKLSQLDSLRGQVESQKMKMNSIQVQISTIRSESESARIELSQIDSSVMTLNNRISHIENILNTNVSSGSRRELLREKMRKSMEVEKLVASKRNLVQIVQDAHFRIEPLRSKRNAVKFLRDKLLVDLNFLTEAPPSLELLENKIEKEQALITDSRGVENSLVAALEEAKEKVLMCRTYNVKYPLVLSIARQIASVGCENYAIKQMDSAVKMDAQTQILDSLCPL